MIEIRHATVEDIEAFYGRKPERTSRTLIGLVDGEVVGIGGATLEEGRRMAFVELKQGVKVNRMTVWRGVLKGLEAVGGRAPLFARPDPNIPSAPKFLSRLGFVYAGSANGEDIYLWSGNGT